MTCTVTWYDGKLHVLAKPCYDLILEAQKKLLIVERVIDFFIPKDDLEHQ